MKRILTALFSLACVFTANHVRAAEPMEAQNVVCTGRHPTKPGFVCSDGTKISLNGVETVEDGKTPKFDLPRKLLKISTQIELQVCQNGVRRSSCQFAPWDDSDFVSVADESDCISKARFIAFDKWLRASRQGQAPTITWTCL
jgi:hypothetical protein